MLAEGGEEVEELVLRLGRCRRMLEGMIEGVPVLRESGGGGVFVRWKDETEG